MKRILAALACFAVLLLLTMGALQKKTAVPDGMDPIDPWTYQRMLGKGMDVDWSKTKKGMDAYSSKAVEDLKTMGVSHVRIRIRDDADEALLLRLDQQIADCIRCGVLPVVAYQADALKNDPTEENIRQAAAWWRTVAARYRTQPYYLAFDLVIEVTDALNDQPETLNTIYEALVGAVRETNEKRIVMISPRLRSDAACLDELEIPSQANGYLMAEWHFYAAGPSKTNARKLWTTGTPAEKALVMEKIRLALDWQEKTNVPTWVGAWMPGDYNDANAYSVAEQQVFAAFLRQALDNAGIPFAVNADSHFYNRTAGTWYSEMLPLLQTIYGNATPQPTELTLE